MQAKANRISRKRSPEPILINPPDPQSLSPPMDNESETDIASLALSSRAIVKVRTVARSTVITIPVEIRKGLDLTAGDKVLLTLEDHSLKVTKE
jgi:AbrB family looped-hinge helix DNA binding protein